VFGKPVALQVALLDSLLPGDRNEEKNKMFSELVGTSHAGRKLALRGHLLALFALGLALSLYPSKAHAQVVGELRANIPFQFHVGNTKLPAGEYTVRMVEDSDLTLMEISSADGSASTLFQVQEVEASTTPTKSELIFNKYGDQYFLAQLFDEGEASGSQLPESRYEKRVIQQGTQTQAKEHVPAHGRTQQGK
jgi:hypothetical protein